MPAFFPSRVKANSVLGLTIALVVMLVLVFMSLRVYMGSPSTPATDMLDQVTSPNPHQLPNPTTVQSTLQPANNQPTTSYPPASSDSVIQDTVVEFAQEFNTLASSFTRNEVNTLLLGYPKNSLYGAVNAHVAASNPLLVEFELKSTHACLQLPSGDVTPTAC